MTSSTLPDQSWGLFCMLGVIIFQTQLVLETSSQRGRTPKSHRERSHTQSSPLVCPSCISSVQKSHRSRQILFLTFAFRDHSLHSLSTLSFSSVETGVTVPDLSGPNRARISFFSDSSVMTLARRSSIESVAFTAIKFARSSFSLAFAVAISSRRSWICLSIAARSSRLAASCGSWRAWYTTCFPKCNGKCPRR